MYRHMMLLLGALALPVMAETPADPAPPATAAPAPDAPQLAPPGTPWAQSPGIIIANKEGGFPAPVDPKVLMGIIRGITQETPGKHRTLIYLPPAKSASLNYVLEGVMKWNEFTFERQMPIQESAAARPLYKRLNSETEVLAAVARDPGGLGIVAGNLLLTEQVVVLWSKNP